MSAVTPSQPHQVAQRRDFWVLMGYAVVLGVFGALFALAFMGVVKVGGGWYSPTSNTWMGGHWWWVAVSGAAGVAVGLLRMVTKLPDKTPGLVEDMQDQYVDPAMVTGIALVSAASLVGGASLGPEKALGTVGGGVGQWLAQKRGRDLEDRQVATLSGFAGAYGGLFSSTVLVTMMIIELVRPGGRRFTKVLVSCVLSGSVSFGIYFAVAGAVFLDAYPVPAYSYKNWYLVAGVGLGLLAAVLVTVLGVIVKGVERAFDAMKAPSLVKSTIGGLAFGVIGVALPLTMFTGSGQLSVVLKDGSTLGLGLVVVLVLAKMVTFAVSAGSGFIGGPIFPTLFIGGSAGVAVHLAVPGLPLGLTFACLLAAVPGALVAAPFTFVLLAAFLTEVGALNTAPVLLAVVTAYLAVEAVKYVMVGRKAEAAASAQPA